MGLKVIITGATGMVGEGVLFECLQHPGIEKVLIVGRRHYAMEHPRLQELLLPDFFQLEQHAAAIKGYDACFFCAGVSSIGMKEEKYTYITYDTTIAFARSLLAVNGNMVFCYVTGAHTDSTESGKVMWARIKGRTENALMKLPFRAAYNFRPGGMLAFKEQKNSKAIYRVIVKLIGLFAPKSILTLQELGRAMINAANLGYTKPVLEIADIKILARSTEEVR